MIMIPRPPRLFWWLPVAVLLLPALGQAFPYTFTFVPGVHDADRPALKVDASGAPHVVWHALEASPILLRYATFDGSNWTTEDVDTIEIGNSTPSLQLAGDMPIVVDTRKFWNLRYAERTAPGAWSVESANVHGGARSAALALGLTGARHVFYGSSIFNIETATRTAPGSWPGTVLWPDVTSVDYASTALAVDASGDLHASFQILNSLLYQKLYYAERIGGTWHFPEPIVTFLEDAGASLAIGSDGVTTISVKYGVQGVGMFHRDGPQNWSFEQIDAAGQGRTSLAWDDEGRAHVAYVKAGAIWQGVRPIDGAWVIGPVTTPAAEEIDDLPSLALDPDGDATIAFVRISPRESGGYERALGIAHDVKTLSADLEATGDLRALSIESVAPQPVHGRGTIVLRLAHSSNVTLELIAIDGRRVAKRALGVLSAGSRTVVWEPGALAPGVYMLRALGDQGAFATCRWVAL